jgi:outer membrane biosynthesis protein TonB
MQLLEGFLKMIETFVQLTRALKKKTIELNNKYTRLSTQFDELFAQALADALAQDAITDQQEIEAAVSAATAELRAKIEQLEQAEIEENELESITVSDVLSELEAAGIVLEQPTEPEQPTDPEEPSAPEEPTEEEPNI